MEKLEETDDGSGFYYPGDGESITWDDTFWDLGKYMYVHSNDRHIIR